MKTQSALWIFVFSAIFAVTTIPAAGGWITPPQSDLDAYLARKAEYGLIWDAGYGLFLPKDPEITPAEPGVPAHCAQWPGLFAGGAWDGVRPAALIVHSVDFSRGACTAVVSVSRGVSTTRRYSKSKNRQSYSGYFPANINPEGVLSFVRDGKDEYSYRHRGNGVVVGHFNRGGSRSVVKLTDG